MSGVFVIFAHSRTGSTMVQDMLDARSDTRCFLELRHPMGGGRKTLPRDRLPPPGRDLAEWLLGTSRVLGKNVGTKEILDHLSPEDFSKLGAMRKKIITDRHPVAMMISLKQAQNGRLWNRYEDGKGMFGTAPLPGERAYRPVRIAPDEYERHVLRLGQLGSRVDAAGALIVAYADMLRDPERVASTIREYLELPFEPAGPRTVRLHPEPLAERCENIGELLDLHRRLFPECRRELV